MASLSSGGISSTTTANDQEKFIAAKLIQRAYLSLVCASVCDRVDMPQGAGKTAYFVRYARMSVPLTPITEGTDPAANTFVLETVNVVLDQWGDSLELTDVAELTTKHPLLTEASNLLADNAQRVIDREVQIVWLAGTRVQYGDGTVTARRSVTAAMKISDTIIHNARVTLINAGAPPRDGPAGGYDVGSADAPKTVGGVSAYVGVTDPAVTADIQTAGTSLGTWASVAMYANAKQLYNAEVGTWLRIRWVESNFVPKFRRLGNDTEAVVSTNSFGTDTPVVTDNTADGGSLKANEKCYFKVTRKEKTRGFEEWISRDHYVQCANDGNDAHTLTFDFTNVDSAYVYSIYFETGSNDGTDAHMKLAVSNLDPAVTPTVKITAHQSTGSTAPDNTGFSVTAVTVHVVYLHGNESCNWVGLQNLQVMMSIDAATTDNRFKLRRTIAYKFMGKAMIRDQDRMLRLEIASAYA